MDREAQRIVASALNRTESHVKNRRQVSKSPTCSLESTASDPVVISQFNRSIKNMTIQRPMAWPQKPHRRLLTLMALAFGCVLLTGCQAISGSRASSHSWSYRDRETGILVERGRPNAVIDGLGCVVGAPTKLALWDCRADNHEVSRQTEGVLLRYLSRNQLNDSMVRINQYDPCGEWMRLTSNKRLCPGWRYTAGVVNHLKYTLLPGRVFGGDWYNPFTDTTHVYSDIPPLVISRAAYAKDVRSRDHPGAYAASQLLPIIRMVHETLARKEALAYSERFSSDVNPSEAHRILSPDYGSSWGAQLASFLPFGAQLGRLAGAAVGHATNYARGTNKASSPGGAWNANCDEATGFHSKTLTFNSEDHSSPTDDDEHEGK
jgi:hypothetical protein